MLPCASILAKAGNLVKALSRGLVLPNVLLFAEVKKKGTLEKETGFEVTLGFCPHCLFSGAPASTLAFQLRRRRVEPPLAWSRLSFPSLPPAIVSSALFSPRIYYWFSSWLYGSF